MPKRNKMCPICYFKKLFLGAPEQEKPARPAYENGVRRTPLMGWSSWNTFRNNIDEKLILDTARAMKDTGLLDAGYCYVNLDDNWHSNMRDENGEWQGDLVRFPHGMAYVVDRLNEMGFKAGIYSSNGTLTCEDLPASLGRERDDARTLAKWGFEYFKYDFCHNIPVPEYAPLVYGIEISEKGSGKGTEYQVSNAILKGLARRMKDERLPGGQYVSGMDAGAGSIVFDNIVVDNDGEYVLTVLIKKYGQYEKYLGRASPSPRRSTGISPRASRPLCASGRAETPSSSATPSRTTASPPQYSTAGWQSACKRRRRKWRRQTALQKSPSFSPSATAGNMWRTTPDIRPWWPWIKVIYSRNVKLWKYASPAHFNDPDMLEVGNGKLTYDQNLAHFALWCMMSAPLVLGNDIRKITKPVLDIVTNRDLIAIDQDALAKQAKRVKRGMVDVLAKPLADGGVAVCFFNRTAIRQKSSLDIGKLQRDDYVAMSGTGGVMSMIAGEAYLKGKRITAIVPANGVAVVKLK